MKIGKLIVNVSAFALLWMPVHANAAYDWTNGNVKYTFTIANGEATITHVEILESNIIGGVSMPSHVRVEEKHGFETVITWYPVRCVGDGNPVGVYGNVYLYHCTSLGLGNGIVEIGANAFKNYGWFTGTSWPDSIKKVGVDAFAGCGDLGWIATTNLAAWCDIDFANAGANPLMCTSKGLAWTDWTYFINGYPVSRPITDMVVPNGVKQIKQYAFCGHKTLETIELPWSCEKIGTCAFSGCTNLTLALTRNVTSIGDGAFRGCYRLRTFTMDGSATNMSVGASLTMNGSVTNIGAGAFQDCGLQTVSLGSGLTSVSSNLFQGCSSLLDVDLGANVKKIGAYAFQNCTSLTNVVFPSGLTSIGDRAFEKTRVGNGTTGGYRGVELPNTVTNIGSYAFHECGSIYYFIIPTSVKTLGTDITKRCDKLANIIGPRRFQTYFQACNPTAFYTYNDVKVTFDANGGEVDTASTLVDKYSHIDELPVPTRNGFMFLGWFTAAAGGSQVTSSTGISKDMTLYAHWEAPQPVLTIEDGVVVGVELNGVTELEIPDGVTSIGDWAFYWCDSLTSVTIPDGVVRIGYGAFYLCGNLTSLILPDGDIEIDGEAFAWCLGLADADGFIIVRDVLYDYCGNASEVEIPDGVTSIGDWAFYGRYRLTSVVIPDSVTNIGEYAFYGCDSLTSVVIPDSVTNIGEYAFYGCDSLTSVVIPDSVTSIGEGAFSYCENLTNITLSVGVERIDGWAFEGCRRLTSITIPHTVTYLDSSAFEDCSALAEIHMPLSLKERFENIVFTGCDARIVWCWTVTLDANGGMFGDNSTTTISVREGAAVGVLPVPLRWNHAFLGWFNVENCSERVTASTVATNSMTLCAHWEAVEYEWSYRTDRDYPNSIIVTGATNARGDMAIPDTIDGFVVHGLEGEAFIGNNDLTAVRIPVACTSLLSPLRQFAECPNIRYIEVPGHWAKTQQLLNTMMSSALGVWNPNDVRVVAYDINTFLLTPKKDGSSVGTLYAPKRSGYVFLGWYTAENGGQKITESMIVTEPITVYAHWEASDWEYEENADGGITITGYSPTTGYVPNDITVPSEIGGKQVVAIGKRAFEDCRNIESVTIPDGIVSIGQDAFVGCWALERVDFPASLLEIGHNIFWYCHSLTNVAVAVDNPVFMSTNGLLCTKDGTQVFEAFGGIRTFEIPDTVKTILPYSFYCRDIEEINIPAGVTNIGHSAFTGCHSLRSVSFEDGLKHIGPYAFSGCTMLTEIETPSSLVCIDGGAFRNCPRLETVRLNEGLESIGTSYYWGVFDGCTSLKTVYIPATLEFDMEKEFRGCPADMNIFYIGDYYTIIFDTNGGTPLELDEKRVCVDRGIGTLPAPTKSGFMFAGWFTAAEGGAQVTAETVATGDMTLYAHWEVPQPVFTIEDGVLVGVDLNGVTELEIPDGVTNIGSGAFLGCSGLTSVTIPDSVTNIGSYAFADCGSLASVILPDGNIEIGGAAFLDCFGLADANGFIIVRDVLYGYYGNASVVEIPEGVTSIGDWAFYWCDSLTSVTIPDGVVRIGYGAFYLCGNLTSLILPDGDIEIDGEAFAWCLGLADADGFIIVRDVLYDYCGNASEVEIPDGVTSIGDWAFEDCTNLTSVTIPDSVTSIGESAFSYCENLTNITLSVGVERIDGWAFEGCRRLTSITIPHTVTYLDSSAFEDCSALAEIHMPLSLKERFENIVFTGCDARIVWCWTVTLDANGGMFDGNGSTNIFVREGCALGTLPVLTRNGYLFLGWFTASEGGTQVTAETVATGDLTLYAHWTVSPFSAMSGDYPWTVDGDGYWRNGDLPEWANTWAEVTVQGPCRVSFSWMRVNGWLEVYIVDEGWYRGGGDFDVWQDFAASLVDEGEHTVRFQLYTSPYSGQPNTGLYCLIRDFAATPIETRTLRLDANGGETEVSEKCVADGCEVGTLPVPVWNGAGSYRFLGWFTAAEGGERVFSDTVVLPSWTRLYAHWREIAPPVNDDFADATAISGASGSVGGTTVGSSREADDLIPDEYGDYLPSTVWYRWTAPEDGRFVFKVAGIGDYEGWSAAIGVTTGRAEGSNAWSNAVARWESVAVDAAAGTVYWIEVGSYYEEYDGEVYEEEFDFALSWGGGAAPANDNFANATEINGASGRATGTNWGAGVEEGEPLPLEQQGYWTFDSTATVWWRWTAPTNATFVFKTQGSDFDTVLGVYTGVVVDALETVAANDEWGDESTSAVTFDAVMGTTYYIAVGGYGDDMGNIVLRWGIDIDDVVVEAGGGKTVTVPGTWLSENTERDATDDAANGRKVWKCFVLGLDPEDPDDDFQITRFWMEGGEPKFEYSHTTDGSGVSFEPRIRKLGKAELGDEWAPVPEGGNPAFRFFKVEVTLP